MKRREFIRGTGAAMALAAVGCGGRSAPASGSQTMRSIETFGIQLYTIRSLMQQSVPDALALVAGAGYREVEFAGYFGHEPSAIRDMLDSAGLVSPSSHVSIDALASDPAGEFATANAIGQKYIVVPWLAAERRTIAGYREFCAQMNGLGAQARDAGVTLGYHNHDFEFETVEGTVPYDLMLQELDPDLVKMQLDLFWIWFAGKYAVTYLDREPDRYVSCHVKDGYADGSQTVIGLGDVEFPEAFAAGKFEHYFVENDQPENVEKFVRQSAAAMSKMTF